MPNIIIDGIPVEAGDGETVLEAARRIGVEIPTLCHMKGFESGASCMVCAVRTSHNGQFIPACGSRAVEGMSVETASEEVRAARRMALELLFSDHLGDCLSPCQRICPAHLSIPAVLKHVREGEFGLAAGTIRHDLAVANVLCRVCHRPCESGCRRGAHDEAVAIASLVRHSLEKEGEARTPVLRAERNEKVVVVGSGFSGLSAAWFLRQKGFPCSVFESADELAPTIRAGFPDLDPAILEAELAGLKKAGVEFFTASGVEDLAKLREGFSAVIIAAGESASELGLEMLGSRVKVDKDSMMTGIAGVFAVGSALRPGSKPVASVADGKEVAACVELYLDGREIRRPAKPFSCFIGKLDETEMEAIMQESNPHGRELDEDDRSAEEIDRMIEESHRCVQCNCPKIETCKLRDLAMEYQINLNRFSGGGRAAFKREVGHPLVNFEPGKCIRCGNCIKVASDHREKLGLTFIGRGFDVHLGVPLDGTMEEGLLVAAEAAVAACPVGALSLKDPTFKKCGDSRHDDGGNGE